MRPSVSSIDGTLTQRLLCYLSFAKEKIALAPNNPSAWNYLRGALEHTNMPFSTVATFVEPYTTSQPPSREMNDDVVDLDNVLVPPHILEEVIQDLHGLVPDELVVFLHKRTRARV